MKTKLWVSAFLMAAVLLGAPGCGKKETAAAAPQANGVTVDMPKLRTAFQNCTPEIKQVLDKVSYSFRYGDHMAMLVELDKLASDPAVTEPQKKAVAELIEQVKQVMNKAAAPKPAQ